MSGSTWMREVCLVERQVKQQVARKSLHAKDRFFLEKNIRIMASLNNISTHILILNAYLNVEEGL